MSRGFGSTYGTGASDVVTTGVTSSGSDRRSFSFWFLRNGTGGGAFGHVFLKNFSEEFFWNNSFSQMMYARCNAGGTQTSRYTFDSTGNTLNSTGVWNHVLLTHDQSGGITAPVLWCNHVQPSVVLRPSGVTATNSNPYLIGNDAVNTRVWDGLIAHFTIWDDIILGQGEAFALWAGAHPMSIASDRCVCYLPLDGIHSPETDFVMANGPAAVTGAKFGTLQPATAPLYIPRRDWLREMQSIQAAAAAMSRGPMVSLLY